MLKKLFLDDYMYIVLEGEIKVVMVDEFDNVKTLRVAKRGDRVHSLLSLVDVLTVITNTSFRSFQWRDTSISFFIDVFNSMEF